MNFLFPMWPSQQGTFGTNIWLEDFKIIHRVKAFTVQWLLLTVEQREFSTDLGCVVQKLFSVEIMSKCQKSCAGKTGLLEPFSITTHHHNIECSIGNGQLSDVTCSAHEMGRYLTNAIVSDKSK